MQLDRTWRRHFLTLSAITLAALAAGYLLGYPAEVLLCCLVSYLIWFETNIYRLFAWLKEGRKRTNHTSGYSIWRDLNDAILQLERRNRKRKRRLNRLLRGFRDSMSALPDATVVLSDSGEAEWWNGAATDLLGLRKEKSKSTQIDVFIQDPEFIRYMEAGDYSEPLEIASPVDRDILLLVRIVPYSKGKRLLQARDITLMRRLTNVRREFVANASHELRTPLTVMHGYLETMLDDPVMRNGPWHQAISQMFQQSSRVKGIVEDMLTLSQLEQGRQNEDREPVDIVSMLEMIRDEAELLSGNEGHRIQLKLESDSNLAGTAEKIHSIFANLVSNAVRYTPAGGKIIIGWRQDEHGAHFSVKDTGIGIEPHHISKLTERFYRVDIARSREKGGTGLGLAIVKHILNLMGGQLSIDSEPGVGSTFTCHFPPELVIERPGESHPEGVIQYPLQNNISVI